MAADRPGQAALLATPTREEREAMLENLVARFDEDPGWLHSQPPRVISTHLKRYGLQIGRELTR